MTQDEKQHLTDAIALIVERALINDPTGRIALEMTATELKINGVDVGDWIIAVIPKGTGK